jgi:hypothetical protein
MSFTIYHVHAIMPWLDGPFKGTVSQKFLLQVFFHESPSPKPLKITLGSFRSFSKFLRDIRKLRFTTGVNDTSGKFSTNVHDTVAKLPPVSMTPAANLATSSACVVDSKFANCVNDTGGKYAAVDNDASGK